VGVIPRILLPDAAGLKEYGVLATTERIILVLQKTHPDTGMAAVALGSLGREIGRARAKDIAVDYASASPEALAQSEGSVPIPHTALGAIRLRWSWGYYRLRIVFRNSKGKRKRMDFWVLPPSGWELARTRMGVRAKAARLEYAVRAREVFQRALPEDVAPRAEWGV